MRGATAALGAILILFAVAGCDLEVPAMPMVGEEAGGGGVADGESAPTQAGESDGEPPPNPPDGALPPVWALPLSIGPVGLLIIIIAIIGGALLASRKSRGRKSR